MNQPPYQQPGWGPAGPGGPGGPGGPPPYGGGGPGWGPPPGGYGYGPPPYKPPKSTSPLLVIGVILALVFVGFGTLVGIGVYIGYKESKDAATRTTELVGTDGKAAIEIPGDWTKQKDLHHEAGIQAGNLLKGEFVVVLSESKQDFETGFSLDRYAEVCLTQFTEKSKKVEQKSTPKRFEINGRPAIQYEVKATVDSINLGYIITYIEGPKSFHQVVGWTMKSKFEENRDKLTKVASSLRER